MAKRNTPLVPGEFYHVFNRGNSRQIIFRDDKDIDRFIKLLYLCNSENNFNFRDDIIKAKIDAWDFNRGQPLVSIGAWTLMPNHFHLYITVPNTALYQVKGEKGEQNISFFLEKLTRAYSRYFNTKYDRTGSLFEGKFKSVHVKTDTQGKYLFSYISLNALKLKFPKWKEEGVKNAKESLQFLNSYRWSSFIDYIGVERPENVILDRKNFLDYFNNPKTFKEDIFEWLTFEEEVF